MTFQCEGRDCVRTSRSHWRQDIFWVEYPSRLTVCAEAVPRTPIYEGGGGAKCLGIGVLAMGVNLGPGSLVFV
jgi:hypothetical protein